MAPEQVEADERGIDVRADIYLLGLVLAQAMLIAASDDKQQARTVSGDDLRSQLPASLRGKVEAGGDSSPDPASAFASVPAELRAIAARALARDRDLRYESAAAMAEDLRHWLKREPVAAMEGGKLYRLQCFIRRNALASAAAAGISISLVAGIVLALHGMNEAREGRAEAEQARTLAEQRRNDAEELIRFMLGDFAAGLRSIGRLELLDGVGSEALRYLTAQQAGDDPDSALNRARALRTLGEVQVQRQQFDAAEEPLREAAALLAPFEDAQDPELAEIHFESGQIAFWRGLIAYRQQDLETTEHHWQHYLRAARRFSETTDDPVRAGQEMGYALNNLGTLAEARHQLQQALEYFQQSARFRRELADKSDPNWVMGMANSLSWISRVQNALGHHAEAWSSAEEALQLITVGRATNPEDARLRQAEINFRLNQAGLAALFELKGRDTAELRRALELAEQDVANDPTQTRRQTQLARIAFTLATRSDIPPREAAAALETGRNALQQVAAEDLNPDQTIELPALQVAAELHLAAGTSLVELDDGLIGQGRRVLERLIGNLLEQDVYGADFRYLVQITTELAGLLEQTLSAQETGQKLNPRNLQKLLGKLDEMPEALRTNLRVTTARIRLHELLGSGQDELAELRQSADRARAEVRKSIQSVEFAE